MLAKLCLTVASAALLASCASTNGNGSSSNGSGSSVASRGKATHYCAKAQLVESADGYSCNWEANAASACNSFDNKTLGKSQVSGAPRPAGMCPTGVALVAISE